MANPNLSLVKQALERPNLANLAPRRPRNREATIRAVLESAQRLFTTKGFDQTSLVDIASETGLSPRGVILHFSSKADIAAELMLRDLHARAQSYFADNASLGAADRIMHFFAWLAEGDRRWFINFPALWSFSARWSEKLERSVEDATDTLLMPVRHAIEHGVASGELKRVESALACDVLWTSYLSGLRRAAIHGGSPADALAKVERTLTLFRA